MSDERTIKPNAPADFTPQLGDYKTLQPFRYWCQKVLPLVYDDSLSYYELLCKVVDYLNKTMEDVETLNGDVNSLHTAYTELQSYVNNYFNNLDVQQEINNKLDSMAKDGTLTNLIKAYIDPLINEQNNKITVLENRMNTFASLPEGSTSGNAELIDIRVPTNGFNYNKPYPTAGEAVRGQASSLKEDLTHFENDTFNKVYFNLLHGQTIHDDTFIDNTNGEESSSTSFFSFKNIDIRKYIGARLHTYSSYTGSCRSVVFRKENGDYISGTYPSASYVSTGVLIPTIAKTMDISFSYENGRDTDGYPIKYYASVVNEKEYEYHTNDDLLYGRSSDIFMPYKGARKPIISIIFDGDFDWNSDMCRIAESHGYRVGFATHFDESRLINNGKDLYLAWQGNGHEILVHGYYNVGQGSQYTPNEIAERIKKAYDGGIAMGYDLHGYVAYQGNTVPSSVEEVKKWFDYGYTSANHNSEQLPPNNEPCMYIGKNTPYNMFRYSIEVSPLDKQKEAVDKCIETNGFLCFYGHAESDTPDNLTRENFDSLLTYIDSKVSKNLVEVLTPYKAMQKYFTVRYSDVYESIVDISNKITVNENFNTITKQVMWDKIKKVCYVNIRLRALLKLNGNDITYVSGLPYALTRFYIQTNNHNFSAFIGDGYIRTLENYSLNEGEDIYLSATYYSSRTYEV